jgi:hypothetical protein
MFAAWSSLNDVSERYFQREEKEITQIDMTRTIPALAAFDMVASPPLVAKVLVSPKAVFSVTSE